ncbi:hypothetical protein ID866_4185 [Astraeus odoratus]|nr:hypothetical protein ID866_4185 [Astraeus odoratus]
MSLHLCENGHPFDFLDICIRTSWSALLPAVFVAALCIWSIPFPFPRFIHGFIIRLKAPFQPFITLREAEALDAAAADGKPADAGELADDAVAPLWRTVLLSFVALVQALIWFGTGAYQFITDKENVWPSVCAVLMGASWLYGAYKPIFHPRATTHLDLFALYVVHLVFAITLAGATLYEHEVLHVPFPPRLQLLGMISNLVSVLVELGLVCSMPFELPSDSIKKEDIYVKYSPEDYTTIFEWITFSWVYPLIKRGTNTSMNEEDVWDLSPTMQSRPLFAKFSTVEHPSLVRRIFVVNSMDMIFDVMGTFISIILNYASPYFLRCILDIVNDDPTPEGRVQAYIYAFLAFLCTVLKSEADLQHLWYSRRAGTRTRVELMAAIYDKALKRKDYSGIIDKDKVKQEAEKKAGILSSEKPNADDPKAGADVGKIVNLMAGDANRIAMMISSAYLIYGAPIEVVVASVFLYQLLGISAFAGFVVVLVGWPLNSYVTKRSIRIHKGVSVARDKRMGVLNELITSVKFIKFFAWEDKWIQRVMDARAVEIEWIVKACINSVMFRAIWSSAPILVSLISFAAYVYQGNKLTVPIAFTAITLFNMIRQPLNIIPSYIVQILQTMVAVRRIETYLAEEEVTEQVSSLKKSHDPTDILAQEGLAIDNGTFRWNEVPEEPTKENGKAKQDSKNNGNNNVTASSDDAVTVIDSSSMTGFVGDHKFELKDISVRFPEGELTVITGPTASGKTAMLLALLGELTLVSGKLIMLKNTSKIDDSGHMYTISYAAQMPWLRHQSIKENILFGQPYDEERYNMVVECCALRPDLDILEDGDETEIGARVALARAVYARTKYILLDDPLSAVDSHTARFLYERLLRGPLLANRTVILVTHHVELVLPGAHYLIRMLDGRIDTQGTIKDLHARGVLDYITQDSAAEVKQEEPVVASDAPIEAIETNLAEPASQLVEHKKPRKLVKEEHRERGGVKFAIYKAYMKASSYWTWCILAVLVACSQILGVVEKFWFRAWGQAYGDDAGLTSYIFMSSSLKENDALTNGYVPYHDATYNPNPHYYIRSPRFVLPDANEYPLFYVGVYGGIGLTVALVSVLSSAVQYVGALKASRTLFRHLLTVVVRATMRWHDVTPQGRMLNRFGKDIETIDGNLAHSMSAVNSSLATFATAILTVAFIFPPFLIPAAVMGYFYRMFAIGYLNTGRDLRRMESNSRSPIFSGFAELLDGIVTVRAFSAERRFLNDLHRMVDLTTKMWYNFWMTNRWLLLNFDVLGGLAVLITTLFALSGYVDAGMAAVCITSAMTFTNSVYWACRFWTTLELDLNSVERVVEYLDLPQEPPTIIESNRPPAYWPSNTSNNPLVSIENLVIKYAPELPPVLHNVSFTLNAKERVGLLGRTGSGKSTLAMSILRFVDPTSGCIVIDGIDISTVGLHDLRSRLTFIPQDATLFSGTLRDNLDPFHEHEDSECLDVLYRVRMLSQSAYESQRNSRAPSRASTPEDAPSSAPSTVTEIDARITITLDTQVSAGGTNFSQGQRQLIAMARALLRRSSIIILDEATSSIDFDTDAKIQAAIREEFNESLLLTVAHRLRTVIDYDRLIVLDKGEVVECDTPLKLIQRENGIFRNMCLKSGTFTELEAAAKAKAEKDLAARS